MAQLEWAGSEVPQLFDVWNPALAVIAIDFSEKSPLLLSATVCAADSCPVTVPGKFRDQGLSESDGAAPPVPLSAIVWVPALSTRVSVPFDAPVCVGANSTVIAHWLSAPIELPQLLLASTNGPLTVALVIVTAMPPLFSAVTSSAADAAPTCTSPKLTVVGSS
jgi:hypothetical protein